MQKLRTLGRTLWWSFLFIGLGCSEGPETVSRPRPLVQNTAVPSQSSAPERDPPASLEDSPEPIEILPDRSSDTRTTNTGVVFTRIIGGPIEELWGVIGEEFAWGPTMRDDDQVVNFTSFEDARNECAMRRGRLPTEDEYVHFRRQLGARNRTHDGYSVQVFDDLEYDFWTSSHFRGDSRVGVTFNGLTGALSEAPYLDEFSRININAFRCVFEFRHQSESRFVLF